MNTSNPDPLLQRSIELLRSADGLLVTAGAGMGVDSGLPDFRGPAGFWGAYPALGRAGLHFQDIACPQAFEEHPELAWGFYGHRLNLYRSTLPHDGYRILREIGEELPYGAFVFTSNVDGHFQAAGFPEQRVCEIHGSIHYLQCLRGCRDAIWSARGLEPGIDPESCRIINTPPHCPHCGSLARPNILMFGDWGWIDSRQAAQMAALSAWLSRVEHPVVVEIGAGTAIPTVRRFSEGVQGPLIRINRQEWQVRRPGDLGLPLGGLEALRSLAKGLGLPERA